MKEPCDLSQQRMPGDLWWLLVTSGDVDSACLTFNPKLGKVQTARLGVWLGVGWCTKCRFLHRLHGLRIAYKRLTLPYHQLQHLRVTTCQHTSGSSGCETIQGFQDLPSFASSPTNQFDFGQVVVPRVFPETDGFNICQLNNAKLLASPCFSWEKNGKKMWKDVKRNRPFYGTMTMKSRKSRLVGKSGPTTSHRLSQHCRLPRFRCT